MPIRAPRFSLQTHVIAALAVAAAIGATAFGSLKADVSTPGGELPPATDVIVEHTQPLTLSVSASVLKGVGILDVTNEGKETIALSIPTSWNRREVRFVALKAVTADASSLGSTRWSLPPKASVSFGLPTFPASVMLHNPSKVSLTVPLTLVNLFTGVSDRNILLVKELPVILW
ncbi:TPA: hypothetical protein DCL30_04230 [Candidatus Peribacteria bacterium]|nr:MAG: hypothetical protein A3J91_01845 [Candidatus Peribacteria bacterium RIFOXYC2_FULL_58_10]OGJ83987.1 MAG: hypothetical protein A2529_04285 [Candidatus Peribacteria bacterium RIFOXYD2_FULL_58_15]HAI98713.1 hypothetical protein [Candidatus Peribacteria bacterium]HAS34425.1 hypothetical protein [Candidatus Peribacteria bacterium]